MFFLSTLLFFSIYVEHRPKKIPLKCCKFSVTIQCMLSCKEANFAAAFCLLCLFPMFEKSMTNSKQNKWERKTFSSLMPEWQAKLTGGYREAAREVRCLRTCITHAHGQEAHECTSPPTLPKHYLTWQIRMCESLPVFDVAGTCHISVRASRWLRVETKKLKTNLHVILSLSLPVRPLLWVL